MKKKQLAWVLTMAMTAGMLVPYGAAAEEATGYLPQGKTSWL